MTKRLNTTLDMGGFTSKFDNRKNCHVIRHHKCVSEIIKQKNRRNPYDELCCRSERRTT